MSTFSKVLLSESTNGRQVQVVQTASVGTLVHTAHATAQDEVFLYACNTDASARLLTIEWGGAGVLNNISYSIPAQSGLVLVVPGLVLTGGLEVRAFAAAANVVNISGFVNRIA